MVALFADDIRCHRSGDGPPVLLLHCLGVDHGLWDIAAPGLSAEYTVLRYDFPGHHETPLAAGSYTIEDLSAQLGAVLDRERIEQATIGGISLGGLVAQHFAASNPDRVERLLLIDTTPRYSEATRERWQERAATARGPGVAAMTDTLLGVWFTPDFVAENPPAVRYVRDRFAKVSGEGYARACEALAAADLRDLLPDIQAPTLVVCGTEDVPEFLLAARSFERLIPQARIAWLSPARHASILEQPEQFMQAWRSFVEETTGR
jgi:3-oxoadipate enol-lactonase